MKKIIKLIVLLFLCINANAKNDLIIQGSFKGVADNATVLLCQYNSEDIIVAQTVIKSNQCAFKSLPPLQEGVYQIIVKSPESKTMRLNNYFFNIIIDAAESDIEFFFDPSSNVIPTFTKSNSNRNWSEFLKLQKFRLAAINQIKVSNEPNYIGYQNFANDSKNILNNEIQELIDFKKKFITNNYNKWSTYMVKYDLTELSFEEKDKETFWSKFDISNADLINTPIYQGLIRYYLMSFCRTCNEEQYKIMFQEVIDAFSNNETIKKCVTQYIVSGLQN